MKKLPEIYQGYSTKELINLWGEIRKGTTKKVWSLEKMLCGMDFKGLRSQSTYIPLQTPLNFKLANDEGGMLNRNFMLIHYKNDKSIESINY